MAIGSIFFAGMQVGAEEKLIGSPKTFAPHFAQSKIPLSTVLKIKTSAPIL